ncbi:MAG: sugar ABC transporter ATP-binding protein [Actinomycetota bacterium]
MIPEKGQAELGDVVIRVDDIAKSFGSTEALRGVSLTIKAGEIHGLCGQNGAGKSTLVKVLTGQVKPDRGIVSVDGREVDFTTPKDAQLARIGFVDQELSIVPALTVEENLALGDARASLFVKRRRRRKGFEKVLARAGLGEISMSTRAEYLSMAQRQLLEVARLLDRDARCLILDEPTASLSGGDSAVIFEALRSLAVSGHSVLYVSHRLDEVIDLCDRVTVLRDGEQVAERPVSALTTVELARLIVGDSGATDRETSAAHEERFDAMPTGGSRDVRINLTYTNHSRLADFSLNISPGEIIGVAGQVGSGASDTLRTLAGLNASASVSIELDGRMHRITNPRQGPRFGIFFLSNSRRDEGLFLSRSISENLTATRLGALSRIGVVILSSLRRCAGELAKTVSVTGGSSDGSVAELSGGNQQKVFIGRNLGQVPSKLLILDEPTRGVDVGGRAAIHDLIRSASAQGTAVVFASGDEDEVLSLADRVVCMQDGAVTSTRSAAEMTSGELLAATTRRADNPQEDVIIDG